MKPVDRLRILWSRPFGTVSGGCFALIVLVAACGPSASVVPVSDVTPIILSGDIDNLTVIATDASRAEILARLNSEYGIEVRPYDVPDERISIRIVDQPLDAAIEQLLPTGTRYVIRLGDVEIERPAYSDGKKAGPDEARPRDLPTKDSVAERPRPQGPAKIDPALWKEPDVRTGPDLKPESRTVLETTAGSGPRKEIPKAVADTSLRVSFIIKADGSIRVTDVAAMEGAVRRNMVVQGPFLFAIRGQGGVLLHFGALPDPLEVHSYREDGTHDVTRAEEGTFGIWIPSEALREHPLASLTLEFYDGRSVALPQSLDARSFETFARESERIASISGRLLIGDN